MPYSGLGERAGSGSVRVCALSGDDTDTDVDAEAEGAAVPGRARPRTLGVREGDAGSGLFPPDTVCLLSSAGGA